MTYGEVAKRLRDWFAEAGIRAGDIDREVELLLQHVTGWSSAQQHLHADEKLTDAHAAAIKDIADQRAERIPLQYILEEAWFMGLRFNVRPGVLIPRADTETLAEVSLKLLERTQSPLIVDVGTGSGILAIALAHFRPDLRAIAIDVSKEALFIAKENGALHGVLDRVQLVRSDWNEWQGEKSVFDAIISNPPYISPDQRSGLEPEVLDHEPPLALFGPDADGLGFYRSLSQKAPAHLAPGGFIAVEIGFGQAEAVLAIFKSGPWIDLQVHNDLSGIPRVVSGFLP
jgi:release factor glutamine methyltransferase